MFNEMNAATDNMTVAEYKEIYEAIVSLSVDADGYGLFENISEEDVEKCKWIAAICEVLDDVPRSRMEHIFKYRKVDFDYIKFIEAND
jgi:hypothetical protein